MAGRETVKGRTSILSAVALMVVTMIGTSSSALAAPSEE